MPILVLEQLTKVFHAARSFGAWLRRPWQRGEPVLALDEVSLTVQAGELLCLMGSNGAGKTTLMKILAGVVLPTDGRALIDGYDVTRAPRELRARIGYAAADPAGFYDRMTGRQNLAFFASLQSVPRAQAQGRIDELLSLLELDMPDQLYQEYSSGTKQRLALARALLHQPSLLLLDEPTRSLDPVQTERVHGLLRGRLRRQGVTVVLATHQAWEAEVLADRVAVLHHGEIQVCGTPRELSGGPGGFGASVKQWCGGDA
jgi:ABC-2 type transport system ATP-binding protein